MRNLTQLAIEHLADTNYTKVNEPLEASISFHQSLPDFAGISLALQRARVSICALQLSALR